MSSLALRWPGIVLSLSRGRRPSAALAATVAVTTIVVGAAAHQIWTAPAAAPPAAGLANVWIDQNGGACVRNASPAAYVDADACTRDAAEAVWQWGDTVLIRGGATYAGKWTIEYRAATDNGGCDPYAEWGAANTSQCVRIEPAPDETVTMDGAVEIHQGGLWLNGTRTGTWPSLSPTYNWKVTGFIDVESDGVGAQADNTVVNGIDASAIGAFGTDRAMFRQTDAGGRVCDSLSTFIDPDTGLGINTFESKISAAAGTNATNTVFDSIYFHDVYRNQGGATGDCHDGALFIVNGDGITIRNSVWSQNWVYDIQVQNFSGSEPTNILIENNWFGCGVEGGNITTNPSGVTQCNGQAAIQWDDGLAANVLVRYNTFRDTSWSCFVVPCSYSNVRFIGNIGGNPPSGTNQPCGDAGVTFGYNAWETSTCGGTDIVVGAPSSVVVSTSAGSENYHLSNTSNAANNLVVTGTGDYALLTDIDGAARPIGANRDAGSDEQ